MKKSKGSKPGIKRAFSNQAPEYNPVLQAAIYEVVDNQIQELNPPQTKQTFDRLVAEGNSPQEARRLISCVVVSEIFDVLKKSEPYNEARYVTALNRLPKMPWDK